MADFGSRFKQLRLEKKLTQEELKNDFNKLFFRNFTAAAISQYENNKRIPEIDALKDFAKYFNVSVSFLLGETDTCTPNKPKDSKPKIDDKLINRIKNLSAENKKELQKYLELLEIKEKLDKTKDETSSVSKRNT